MAQTPGQYYSCYQTDERLRWDIEEYKRRKAALLASPSSVIVATPKFYDHCIAAVEHELAERAAGRRRQMPL